MAAKDWPILVSYNELERQRVLRDELIAALERCTQKALRSAVYERFCLESSMTLMVGEAFELADIAIETAIEAHRAVDLIAKARGV